MTRIGYPDSQLISIIIVTHNAGPIISECLESLKSLQWPRLEIVVVDNASRDNTLEKVSMTLPKARIIQLFINKGYGGGCNAGARATEGEILLFLNQDAVLTPTFLNKIASTMVNDNRIGICGAIILSWDGNRLVSAGQVFERWTGYALDFGFGGADVSMRRPGDDVFSPNGAAFAVRRDVFEQIGGFNEDLFMYFDETDLAWRSRVAGFRVVCCSEAIARHKIDLRRAHSSRSRYYIDRNSLLSAVRNYEFPSILLFMWTSLMSRIVGILVLATLGRREHARSTARALNDFWALLPRAMRQRRSVHAIRKVKDREVMRRDILATPRDLLGVFLSSLLPGTSTGASP